MEGAVTPVADSGAICGEGLTKRFSGVTAVDALDLTVNEGAIYGFLGPNGAWAVFRRKDL